MKQAEKILTASGKFRIELGLGRILKILDLLHNPQHNLKFIHVAGTNGKGSTCAILEEIFIKAGFKTGKFTSPHLFSYNERIVVNKLPISDACLNEIVDKINKLDLKYNIGLTEFEILTTAGFLYFAEKSCDIVILEVGLGGRLDSTNIIENPLVSIITSISLEHTERLGDTIEKIAKEKAGIIKKGCPVVLLAENKAYAALKSEALRLGGILYETKRIDNTPFGAVINIGEAGCKMVEFGLKGHHQGENLALALKAVEIINSKGVIGKNIDTETVLAALKDVRWKFRIEERKFLPKDGSAVRTILIDACHNPDGARVLREYLNEAHAGKKIKFVFGCLKNKDYKRVLEELFVGTDIESLQYKKNFEWQICFNEFNYPNALKYEEFYKVFLEVFEPIFGKDTANLVCKIENPLKEVFAKKNIDWDLTVFAGSIYMLGEIFKEFDCL